MDNTRCIIFGGGGFIGSYLSERLVQKNYLVTIFTRKSKCSYKNLSSLNNNKKVNFVRGDINNINLINKVINTGDIVFNLIASSVPFSSMQFPLNEIKNHILPHTQLFETACRKGVKKIIFVSSGGGVYGEKPKLPASEEDSIQPESPHSIAKIAIEYFLHYFGKIYGTPYIIYRLSNPYGPRQIPQEGFGIIPTLFSQILQNKAPTLFDNGNLIRDFIYIEDVIGAIVKSFDKKTKYHIYNIGSGKGTALKTLWKEIKNITKTGLYPIFKSKRPIDVNKIILNTNRFKEEFDWSPQTGLSDGLRKTWYSCKKAYEEGLFNG